MQSADKQVHYGKLERLERHLARVLCRNPSPFTLHGTASFIVGDLDRSSAALAVVDPGPKDPRHIDALLTAIPAERISHILVTHTHNDHSPGATLLRQHCDAVVMGMGRHGMGRSLTDEDFAIGADADFVPDTMLQDGMAIQGDGWTLECLHTPGHASNHVCFANPEDDWILVGDHLMAWSTTIISPPDGHLGDFLASSRRIGERPETRLWPAHGGAIDDKKAFIDALLQHRYERLERVENAVRAGRQTIDSMLADAYPDVDRSVWPAARRSLQASLIFLEERGIVESREEDGQLQWLLRDSGGIERP